MDDKILIWSREVQHRNNDAPSWLCKLPAYQATLYNIGLYWILANLIFPQSLCQTDIFPDHRSS